jgi:cbb3-type cytochrome oxidase subunit 3
MTFGKKLDVRRVKSSLVATLSKANPPLIWRFDLERNHSFTLALQGQDNEWELGVTSPRGEFNPVARFPLREDAEEALAAIGRELAKGRLRWVGCLLKAIGVLALLFFIAVLVWSIVLRTSQNRLTQLDTPPEQAQAGSEPVSPPPPEVKNGIPLPADQVLQPPP